VLWIKMPDVIAGWNFSLGRGLIAPQRMSSARAAD
jgi:hypothetical protein